MLHSMGRRCSLLDLDAEMIVFRTFGSRTAEARLYRQNCLKTRPQNNVAITGPHSHCDSTLNVHKFPFLEVSPKSPAADWANVGSDLWNACSAFSEEYHLDGPSEIQLELPLFFPP
jgi:hypothetical protein